RALDLLLGEPEAALLTLLQQRLAPQDEVAVANLVAIRGLVVATDEDHAAVGQALLVQLAAALRAFRLQLAGVVALRVATAADELRAPAADLDGQLLAALRAGVVDLLAGLTDRAVD